MRTSCKSKHTRENKQYELTAKQLCIPAKRVRACVKTWIMEHPLLLLKRHRFPYVREFCYALQGRALQLAVFSDYPAQDKIKALDLPEMLTTCSTDRDIDIFKPSPKGLLYTIERLCVPAHSCLLIGDRDDRDGECARRAGIKYLLKVDRKTGEHQFECYKTLLCDLYHTE